MAFQVGTVEMLALQDAELDFDGPTPPAGLSKAELDAAYPDVVGGDGRWAIPVTCYLLRSGATTILVDAGVGPWGSETEPGRLDAALRAVDVDPSEVDFVVITHLHFDHVGWNATEVDGVPVLFFPRATYVLSAAEWSYLLSEVDRHAAEPTYVTTCVRPLEAGGRLRLVDPPVRLTDEVSLLPAAGHTPGHVVVRVESRGERATIIGDASHHAGQVEYPQWAPLWDQAPAQAAATRAELFASIAEDASHVVVAGHWGFPGVGHVVHGEHGLRFRAG